MRAPTFLLVLPALPIAGFALLLAAHLRLRRREAALHAEVSRCVGQVVLLRKALEHRQHLDLLKDEFISEVSHELRTPLTSIRGSLGLLSSGVLGRVDDRAANLLRIASSNSERLVRLINDVLDLQRIETSNDLLLLRSCTLGELLAQSVETMNTMAEAAGVRLETCFEQSSELLEFEGNADRLLQVFCNLLSNAIKFSPRQSAVVLRTHQENETLVLRVEDSGRGVPEDKLERIFERFGQIELADARQKGGTGLGLAISRSLIVQHGGTLHAERNVAAGGEPKPGLTLVLRLPLPVKSAAKPEVAQSLVA